MKIQRFFLLLAVAFSSLGLAQAQKPWDNGNLRVSDNGRFLQHENGTPFFWTGETAWFQNQRHILIGYSYLTTSKNFKSPGILD